MTKKLLIDATQPEETRVAVIDDNHLLEFDYENNVRKQLKGNIFLAKITRVEPSLQAAFVDYGGNRHGFLPFSEIHPDYFRIPVEDREALQAELAEEAEKQRAQEEAEDNEDDNDTSDSDENPDDDDEEDDEEDDDLVEGDEENIGNRIDDDEENDADGNVASSEDDEDDSKGNRKGGRGRGRRGRYQRGRGRGGRNQKGRGRGKAARNKSVEIVGGDEDEIRRPNLRKKYKIQEVIQRGQPVLIQVSKEERGNKGAAVSTYISLAGRYCVLMPNSPRAGGVSRKIPSFKERKRMRTILDGLDVTDGMSVILRTAGVGRTKAEIKRDYDYLSRLWEKIKDATYKSVAPAEVHEEANLIKRAIRDLYTRDIDEVFVSGKDGYKEAKDFMKMMIPSHAKRVQHYEDERIPLFHRYQIESQIAAIGQPEASMKSGGYLVINPTEALVSIDVNSGRATKERHIEETALNTNLEAADEVARQLRLRDLGGLVVIDFIDMEDRRNNRKVENRMREALSKDRARVQVGRISNFGLMELSRQRLNPSLTESQFQTCPTCKGAGHVRSLESTTLNLMRELEEEGIRDRCERVNVQVPNDVALYILNNKRNSIAEIEARYSLIISISVNSDIALGQYKIEPIKDGEALKSQDSDDQRNQKRSFDDNNRSGGRRRGRRGGRRRGRRQDEDNQNQDSQDAQSDKDSSSNKDDKKDAKKEDVKKEDSKAKKTPSKRGRKPKDDVDTASDETHKKDQDKKDKKSPTKKTDEKTSKTAASKAKDEAKVESKDETKDEAPKKRGRPKKADASKESESSSGNDNESDLKKPETKKAATKKAPTKKEAAKETKPEKSHPDENITILSDKPKKASKAGRKGWWSR